MKERKGRGELNSEEGGKARGEKKKDDGSGGKKKLI